MKTFFRAFDYVSAIKYTALFFVFLSFSMLESSVLPYSAAPFVASLVIGGSIIPTFILYLCSFLVLGGVGLLGSQAILALFIIIIVCIYRKTRQNAGVEISAYTLVGMIGFIFLGDTAVYYSFEKRILTVIITVALTFLCIIAGKAVNEKGLKFKLGFEEFASIALLLALFGTGTCNLISPYFWRGVSVFIILSVCFIYRIGISSLVSAVLGISLALYHNQITFVSIFLVLSIACESLMPLSRYASAVAIILTDYLLQVIFGVYGGYGLIDFLCVLSGAVVFCAIPTKTLKNLKEKLYSFREKQLVRQVINTNRSMLSGRLYDVSGVFKEMAGAFDIFKKNAITEDKAKSIIEKQVLSEVCNQCEHHSRCKKQDKIIATGLNKMIEIGFAKGKLSLIDMPKEIGDFCLHPNNVLYSTNKLLADFRSYAIENANLKNGRDLIASQALGVSEILRGLAVETGTQLKYQSRLERALCDKLFKKGFMISELLIYGEEERIKVSLITVMKEFSIKLMQKTVSECIGKDMVLTERVEISEDKCYLAFTRSPAFDAVYGLSHATKDGSEKSGDTHAVTRVEGDRLLVALSDGMGSGTDAQTLSSTTLSLIESFYKAGLSSPLILNTVNKLLSINTEDSFTALDLSVIDFNTCTADFIKYGSPYGFIISDQGIRIVEGNSLPLGIIDELKPSVCTAPLNDGDIILLVSDGISDAFGSSGEVIDYLRTLPAKNPQTLADDLLQTAITKNGGQKKDDMTALAVRIFKRTA